MTAKLGITDELRPRMKHVRPVGTGVADGEVDIGIHQIASSCRSRHRHRRRTADHAQQDHRLCPGADHDGDTAAAAKALIDYLALPSSAPVVKKDGMAPI